MRGWWNWPADWASPTAMWAGTNSTMRGGHRHLIKVLAALGVDTECPDWVDAALDDADADGWRAFLPAVTVAIEGSGHWFYVHVPHGDPVSVWITTEDGESVPAAQAEHWVDPREVDGVLTGRATFIVPAGLGVGYHTLHAQNPARDETVEAPLIVTPARLTTADALGYRQRWGWRSSCTRPVPNSPGCGRSR